MIEMLQRNAMAVESDDVNKTEGLDPRVLSSVLISLKLAQTQEESSPRSEDPHSRLLELMHSSPVRAILDSAAIFAQHQGIPPNEALQQILGSLQEIDRLWNSVLMREGLARLSSQYH